jgi:hypothetical protein
VEPRVERAEARLERAREAARRVRVRHDAGSAKIQVCHEVVRAGANDKGDVLERRSVRGVDDVL